MARDALDEIMTSDEAETPVCTPTCPKGRHHCSRHCGDMRYRLSDDPANFPLENRIAPLVYEIKRLETFTPCWSCEGHNGPDGTLWKVPRVWFYCDSTVQLRVFADAITELYLAKKLNVPWRVVLTFSETSNIDTTVSLEPSIEQGNATLAVLQRDIDSIAENLRSRVLSEAHKLIQQID